VWWAQLYEGTQQVRFSTGTADPLSASMALRERLAAARAGLAGPSAAGVTFLELAARAVRGWSAAGGRGQARQHAALAHLRAFFADDPASSIDADRVAAYVAARLGEGAARGTVNVELAALRYAFNAAVEARRPVSPPRIRSLRPAPPRTGRLVRSEVEAVLAQLQPDLVPAVVTLWTTGWRVGEVLSREFRHVVGDQLRVEVGEAKVRTKAYAYPLTSQLRELVEAQRRSGAAIAARLGSSPSRIFHRGDTGAPITYATLRRAWSAATSRAGLAGSRLHDLRRSNVGENERLVGRSLGRTLTGQSDQIFARYGTPDSRQLSAAAPVLEALRLRLPRGQTHPPAGTAKSRAARKHGTRKACKRTRGSRTRRRT
jgi:integrase